ncbi:alpha/beta hydrolase [Brucepastera parasyntrophica]|uniref:alpha/beta hydrolase n=1 Tax=Brucepastera parasyntrophica TaxID=2880008 RepID=UPI00210CBC63|nr:alpha/beta hydrolase [Brucepastera parasyntrophica]ULQ59678.1 alpha/beta hydrolase [Brucepastera parasyntrophica]
MRKAKNAEAFITPAVLLFFVIGLSVSCSSTPKDKSEAKGKPAFTPVWLEAPSATITFPSEDGIPITADLYMAYPDTAPLILLCHRAAWSRGEYLEIAPVLTEMGFNAIAIDQRSGRTKNNVDNATKAAAEEAGKPTAFIDALPDIQAAVDYVKAHYAKGKFILWGSSYSASLVLSIVKNNPGKIDACLVFSPGEYFSGQGKAAGWVATEAADVNIPIFFTSNNNEKAEVSSLYRRVPSAIKTYYLPSGESRHGSEALYGASPESQQTWKAVRQFLEPFAAMR